MTKNLLQRNSEGFYLPPVEGFHSDAPQKLLTQLGEAAAIARAEDKALTVRVLVSAFDNKELAAAIAALGFGKLYDRVEYVRALDEYIPEDGPAAERLLTWVPGLKTYTPDQLGAIYKDASSGDPSGAIPVGADAGVFRKDLEGDLADAAFLPSEAAVQVGLSGCKPAAYILAQVMKKPNHPVTLEGKTAIEGWARLSYLGLLPEFRGRGYGRLVHRHGLRTLRAIGGRTYHGGTARGNAPMRSLFESSGCTVLRLLEEWSLPSPRPSI